LQDLYSTVKFRTREHGAIKEATEQLSFEERVELAAWLHSWKSDEWDEQMKRDIADGKFDAVIREVNEDIRAGRSSDMP
jgi:predicted amidophosphoribosyltransferase